MAKKGDWTDTDAGASPFAALAALKATLPAGPTVVPQPGPNPAGRAPAAATVPKRAVVRLERKGRGGKVVTRLEQLGLPPADLEVWALAAKQALGCGGAVEEDTITLQGDVRERAADWLKKRGIAKISI